MVKFAIGRFKAATTDMKLQYLSKNLLKLVLIIALALMIKLLLISNLKITMAKQLRREEKIYD